MTKNRLNKNRVKRLLTKLKFSQTKGSSQWIRKEMICFFGRSNGKTTFSVHEMSPINLTSFNMEDMEFSDILARLGEIDGIKQEIRKIQLSDILDIV